MLGPPLEPELAAGLFLCFILLKLFSFSLYFDGHNLKVPKRHPGRRRQTWGQPGGFTSGSSVHRDVFERPGLL